VNSVNVKLVASYEMEKCSPPPRESQQMSLWNLIFQTEVTEQRFGTGVLPHHD